MNRNHLLLLATTVMLSPAMAFGQTPLFTSSSVTNGGSPPPEGTSITAQVSACTVSCLQRVLSGDIRLDQCVAGVPECAGLESDASSIRAGICEQAHDLVGQCDAATPSEVIPVVNPTTRPRPRSFQLICQNGTTVGEGWRAHCECNVGEVGVDESRYVLPIRQRRQRFSRSSATVIRVVYCVPSNPRSIRSARQAVSSDLDERVSALESIVENIDNRVAALEAHPTVSADGISEDRVREIVSETTEGFVTQAELQEVTDGLGEIDTSQDRTIEMLHGRLRCLEGDTSWQELHLADGSVQRYRCRHHADTNVASGTQGSFGFRLSGLLSIGFRQLSQNQSATVPIYLASELGITVSVADHWYLEGALGFGYAFEDTPFGDAFQGQYRVGALHLLDTRSLPLGFAFGGILTERYNGGFFSGTFTSDHTLAGGYLEMLFNTPAHGAAFYGFVRFMGGVGLRFYSPEDHVSFDGGIQLGIGVARFGDD